MPCDVAFRQNHWPLVTVSIANTPCYREVTGAKFCVSKHPSWHQPTVNHSLSLVISSATESRGKSYCIPLHWLPDFTTVTSDSCWCPTFHVSVNNKQLMQIWKPFEHLSTVASSYVLTQRSVLFYLVFHRTLTQQLHVHSNITKSRIIHASFT